MATGKRSFLRKARHRWLEPLLIRVVLFLGKIIPGSVSWAIAGILGWIIGPFLSRGGSILDINTRNVAQPLGIRVTPSRMVRYTIASFLDFLNLSGRSDTAFSSLVEVQGADHMLKALERGKGVIAVTAHYSAWELIPRAVSLIGARVGIVGRKLWNPRVSAVLDELRARPGIELVDRGASATGLIRLFRKNTAVGILIDQDTVAVESRFIPFLGLDARTPVGPAGIAIRFGIPVLTLHIARKGKRGYLLTIDPELETSGLQGEEGIRKLTEELNRRIGEWIIEDPDQWIWFHKRWNRRPSGAVGLR